MPFIRSSASMHCLRLILLILSLGEIMPSYSYYIKKQLSYITISAPFSRQPFSYTKYTKSNMRSSYDIKLIFNAKYTFLARL